MRVLPFLLACACASDATETWQQMSPLHGGTAVAPDSPLVLLADPDSLTLPESWADAWFLLTDLSNGATVRGELEVQPGELRFLPDAPLSGAYAWSLSRRSEPVHGPQSGLRPGLVGEARFETGSAPHILGAGTEGDELCFVLSESVDTLEAFEGPEARLISEEEVHDATRPELVDPVSLVCIAAPTASVRVSWAAEAYLWTPTDEHPLDVALGRLRSMQ